MNVQMIDELKWYPSENHPGAWILWRGSSEYIGGYFPADGGYYRYRDNRWDETVSESPIAVPKVSEKDRSANYGVEVEKICPDGCPQYRYWISGIESDGQAVYSLFGNSLVDDTGKAWCVYYGSDRGAFSKLWEQVPSDLRGKFLSQSYQQGHWDAQRIGLGEGVTVMSPVGADGRAKVVGRFRTMPSVEQLVTVLRKADPSRNPNDDPDPLARPKPSPTPSKPDNTAPDSEPKAPANNNLLWLLILGGAGGWLYYRKNNEAKK